MRVISLQVERWSKLKIAAHHLNKLYLNFTVNNCEYTPLRSQSLLFPQTTIHEYFTDWCATDLQLAFTMPMLSPEIRLGKIS